MTMGPADEQEASATLTAALSPESESESARLCGGGEGG